MTDFKNRVFGCTIVKVINSNYNADFSGQPRTLPNGNCYATDKAMKYPIRHYIRNVFINETVFYYKTYNEQINPLSLDETYLKYFSDYRTIKIKQKKKGSDKEEIDKRDVANKLLSCIDIRLFGATFACKTSNKSLKTNISLHGPVQINHGVNIWTENNIYSEQILSPFSNKEDDSDSSDEKEMTTIGRQSKLEEGHYLHHFSVNPQNLRDMVALAGEGAQSLSDEDIDKLKEAMRRGVTWYDSASKAGCENEMLVWIQLKDGSKAVLPNLTSLIELSAQKENGKYVYDMAKLSTKLSRFGEEIETIEVYYDAESVLLKNIPVGTKEMEL